MDTAQPQPRPRKAAKAPPRPPSPREQGEALARAGDLRGLFGLILDTPACLIDLPAAFGQLRRALDVASRQEPVAFCDELFRALLSFAGYASLRLQYLCLRGPGPGEERTGDPLALLLQAQGHAAQMMQAWAATKRLWDLASCGGRSGSGRRPRKPRPVRPGPGPNGNNGDHPVPGQGEGYPRNRLQDLLHDPPN